MEAMKTPVIDMRDPAMKAGHAKIVKAKADAFAGSITWPAYWKIHDQVIAELGITGE